LNKPGSEYEEFDLLGVNIVGIGRRYETHRNIHFWLSIKDIADESSAKKDGFPELR
jgi:hypothetical protein